jgi:hypothetical protein
MPVYGTLPNVAGDRWREIFLARGKSEHRKATCLVKARVLGVQIPGNGIVSQKIDRPASVLMPGKGEKAG